MSSSNSSNLTYADQLILCIFFFNNIKKLQDQNRLIWLIWITVWFHSIFCGCRVMEGCFRVYFSFVNQLFVGKEDDFESRKYRTVALLIAPLLQWRQMPPKAFPFAVRNLDVNVGLHFEIDRPWETRDLQWTVDLSQMRVVGEAKVAIANTSDCRSDGKGSQLIRR
jgi:hypothetical protein